MITAVREKLGDSEQAAQQRGLAAAEKAGQHRDGDHGAHERQGRDAQPHRPIAGIDGGPHVAQQARDGGDAARALALGHHPAERQVGGRPRDAQALVARRDEQRPVGLARDVADDAPGRRLCTSRTQPPR